MVEMQDIMYGALSGTEAFGVVLCSQSHADGLKSIDVFNSELPTGLLDYTGYVYTPSIYYLPNYGVYIHLLIHKSSLSSSPSNNPNNPLRQHPRLTQHGRMPRPAPHRTAPHHHLRLRRRGKHLEPSGRGPVVLAHEIRRG